MEAQEHFDGASASSAAYQPTKPDQPIELSEQEQEQDYFSAHPIPISPRPEHIFLAQVAGRTRHTRNTSTDSTASDYSFLRPCSFDLSTSPITSPSWQHYNATSPSGKLKASLLCKASGTTQSYDPPASERTLLGAGQPAYTGKPFLRKGHQRGKGEGISSSLSEMSLPCEEGLFMKQPVKRVSTSSQLTASIKGSNGRECSMSAAQRYGLEGLRSEDLPSAFDDSDEEGE